MGSQLYKPTTPEQVSSSFGKIPFPPNIDQRCLNATPGLFPGKLPQGPALAMVLQASEKPEGDSWSLCSHHQGRPSRCLAVIMVRLGLPEQEAEAKTENVLGEILGTGVTKEALQGSCKRA